MGFPPIPGVPLPDGILTPLYQYEFGPKFRYADVSGIILMQPPVIRQTLPTVVPRVDSDGNEMVGVASVLHQAPLGTYTGWNVNANGFYRGQIRTNEGSFIPFAKTKAEREALRLEREIYDAVGHEFTIGSQKQLGDILFGELRLPKGRKTKTGYSTDASVLEELRGVHPVVERVLDWRVYTKLRSTYVEALPTLLASDGRLHTTFHQAVAATGRLSSSDPNLQNIPIRTPLGRRIRRAFVAGAPEVTLVAADGHRSFFDFPPASELRFEDADTFTVLDPGDPRRNRTYRFEKEA